MKSSRFLLAGTGVIVVLVVLVLFVKRDPSPESGSADLSVDSADTTLAELPVSADDQAELSAPGALAGAEIFAAIESVAAASHALPEGADQPAGPNEIPRGMSADAYPEPGPPLRIPVGKPIPEIFPYQNERLMIQSLASSYDAARIPDLAAYLDHADPMVRDEARLGLIQLSRPEAAPVLRAAAERAASPIEAAALREAAEFLSQVETG